MCICMVIFGIIVKQLVKLCFLLKLKNMIFHVKPQYSSLGILGYGNILMLLMKFPSKALLNMMFEVLMAMHFRKI